ncbi:MAG: hypothetical protein QNJ58_06335 [Desulfobacterales bacterium]|nr:hypothetical protein [Desulfobacterales bacterium]
MTGGWKARWLGSCKATWLESVEARMLGSEKSFERSLPSGL